MWLVLLSLIFVGLLLYRLFVVKIPHGMPPGPIFGVPLLGTAIHLGENPLPGVKNLRKKYRVRGLKLIHFRQNFFHELMTF